MGALFEGINWWAVLVAVIAFQGLGAAWYGILAKPWMAAVGLTDEQVKGGGPAPYIIAIAGGFLFNLMLAVLIVQFNINSALNGILLSLALMFSVNIGQLAKHYAFAGSVFKDQWKTLFFDAAGDLLAAIAGGLILGIWR